MSKNFEFYAIVDDSGIVSIKHPDYESIKAIFRSRADAEKVLLRNPDAKLRIEAVGIVRNI